MSNISDKRASKAIGIVALLFPLSLLGLWYATVHYKDRGEYVLGLREALARKDPGGIRSLAVSAENLPAEDTLLQFTNLKKLYINTYSGKVFLLPPGLKTLEIKHMPRELAASFLGGTPQLEELVLICEQPYPYRENQGEKYLRNEPVFSFKKLRGLKRLELGSCGIRQFTEELGLLNQLEELRIDEPIESLPEGIGNLRKLKSLELLDSSALMLPASFRSLISLEALYLWDVTFTGFPLVLRSLPGLKRLQLMGARGAEPFKVNLRTGDFPELEWLQLKFPALSGLEGLKYLPNLRDLDISRIGLAQAPSGIGALKGLTHLDLSGNCLSSLPKRYENLTELRELRLYDNRFRDFPSVLLSLPKLKYIAISNNPLGSLPVGIVGMGGLEFIDLINTNVDSERLPIDLYLLLSLAQKRQALEPGEQRLTGIEIRGDVFEINYGKSRKYTGEDFSTPECP